MEGREGREAGKGGREGGRGERGSEGARERGSEGARVRSGGGGTIGGKRCKVAAGSASLLGSGGDVSSEHLLGQWRSRRGGRGGHGGHGPPTKLLVVNFPINLRCYVLLGCIVINVILAINIGDSAFLTSLHWFVNSVVYGITSRRNRYIGPPQTKILATPLCWDAIVVLIMYATWFDL